MLSQPTESRLQIWKLTPLRCFPEQVGSAGTASGFPVRGYWHRDQIQGVRYRTHATRNTTAHPATVGTATANVGTTSTQYPRRSATLSRFTVPDAIESSANLKQQSRQAIFCATAQPMKTNGNSPIRQTPFPGYICLALRDAIHTSIQSRETGLM